MSPFTLFTLFGNTRDDSEKLLEEFTIRISAHEKHHIKQLPDPWKKVMNHAIRQVMRFIIHMSKFNDEGGN